MNLVTLYRDHPDLAEMLGVAREYLVCCPDCGLHSPPAEMYALDSEGTLGCGDCFDARQEAAWAEWCDRLAKEGREVAA